MLTLIVGVCWSFEMFFSALRVLMQGSIYPVLIGGRYSRQVRYVTLL